VAKNSLRVAMIGYQFMGRAHANAWRQAGRFFDLPAEPELAVLCGRSKGPLETAASKLGFQETSTRWQDVVRREDVDAVDVCTPGDSHAEIAIAAAEAGKAVLCEKPLANTVADAERMRDAAVAAGVVHMVSHN
jgi:predicted dehydrogenase